MLCDKEDWLDVPVSNQELQASNDIADLYFLVRASLHEGTLHQHLYERLEEKNFLSH